MFRILHEFVQIEAGRSKLRILSMIIVVVYAKEELLVECVD